MQVYLVRVIGVRVSGCPYLGSIVKVNKSFCSIIYIASGPERQLHIKL